MRDTNEARRHAQRHCFALVSQLKHRFHQRGISEADLWNAIKVDHGVQSRSEIDEAGYVRLSARLQAAQRHRIIFDALCAGIKGD